MTRQPASSFFQASRLRQRPGNCPYPVTPPNPTNTNPRPHQRPGRSRTRLAKTKSKIKTT